MGEGGGGSYGGGGGGVGGGGSFNPLFGPISNDPGMATGQIIGQSWLQYTGIKALGEMLFRGSIPNDIDQFPKQYEFVTTRLTPGMRIYNPFVKMNFQFHALPTPDAIKYIMSFIFFKTPAYEPYGPEVSVLYQDNEFDNNITEMFKKFQKSIQGDTFNTDGTELQGFIGNLFIGNGLKYTPYNGRIIPYKTIIDDRERPWVWGNGEFACVLTDDEKGKTRTYMGYIGLGLDPFRTTTTIPRRSKEHPAYALTKFEGFRNAVYLSARWKLSKPVVQVTNPLLPNSRGPSTHVVQVTNPLLHPRSSGGLVQPPVKAVTYQLPPGWVIDKDDKGEIFYACDAQDITQWERPQPEDDCIPHDWVIKYHEGKKFYACIKTGHRQWELPTEKC